MKNCIAAVITLCIVMQVNDALDFEKTRTAYSAKVSEISVNVLKCCSVTYAINSLCMV